MPRTSTASGSLSPKPGAPVHASVRGAMRHCARSTQRRDAAALAQRPQQPAGVPAGLVGHVWPPAGLPAVARRKSTASAQTRAAAAMRRVAGMPGAVRTAGGSPTPPRREQGAVELVEVVAGRLEQLGEGAAVVARVVEGSCSASSRAARPRRARVRCTWPP
jgi:hypothetical protein